MSFFAHDAWDSQEHTLSETGLWSYDKVQHFVFQGFLGYLISSWIWLWWWSWFLPWAAIMIFALLWEVKDALLRRKYLEEKKRPQWICWLGGNGFSWKDCLASWLGCWAAMGLHGIILYVLSLFTAF